MPKEKSKEYRYIDSLNKLTPELRAEKLKLRLQGEDGPAPNLNEAWTEVLERAYRIANEQQRKEWNESLLLLFKDYALGSNWSSLLEQELTHRAIWLGAIHLATRIPWLLESAKRDMQGLLYTWHAEVSDGCSPLPKVNEPLHPGYPLPETDPVQALIRMSSKFTRWQQDKVSSIWDKALFYQGLKAERVRAGRLWELARWVALQSSDDEGDIKPGLNWLGERWEPLNRALNAANQWPGNLTHFFYTIESAVKRTLGEEKAETHVAELIMSAKSPKNSAERIPLAKALDYYGPENKKVRQHLYSIRKDTTEFALKSDEISAISSLDPAKQTEIYTAKNSSDYLNMNFSMRNIEERTGTGR